MMPSYPIARVFGIPIRVHITLLVLAPLFLLRFPIAAWPWALLMAVGLFACVALHELGHSLSAIRRGARVRQILLLPIGGLAQVEGLPRRPSDEIAIAFAGPAVSFALWALLTTLGRLTARAEMVLPTILLRELGFLNLLLALFNLLPSFPMDGGRIFRAWLTPFLGRVEATRRAAGVGRFLAIALGVWGVLRFNLIHIAIAIFIHRAADAEYRLAIWEAATQPRADSIFGWGASAGEPPVLDADEIVVSPPPYEKPPRRSFIHGVGRRFRGVFDDLFDQWGR